jgi:hypothetical protein
MSIREKFKHIGAELKGHAPFTLLGAAIGLVFMFIFKDISKPHANVLFGIFHPAHVLLSAMVTASLFALHKTAKNFLVILIIGYVGSIGVATMSDSVIPFLGESVLGVSVPSHGALHEQEHEHEHEADEAEHIGESEHEHKIHLGFIEHWYIVNPAAILGVLLAYFLPRTRFPHAMHVLISTWASSTHILMNLQSELTAVIATGILIVLFLAVWLPCCISDIVFPLLFVNSDIELVNSCICRNHKLHSHPHTHTHTEECKSEEANQ